MYQNLAQTIERFLSPVKVHANRLAALVDRYPGITWVILAALMTYPYYFAGYSSYVHEHDVGDGWIPHRVFMAMRPAATEWIDLFYGNRVNTSGLTYKWDIELFRILPSWLAFSAIYFLQRFIGGFFTYLLARRTLGVSTGIALFAGVLFSWYNEGNYDVLSVHLLPVIVMSSLKASSWFFDGNTPTMRKILLGILLVASGAAATHVTFLQYFMFILAGAGLIILSLEGWRPVRMLPLFLFGIGYLFYEYKTIRDLYLFSAISHRIFWKPEEFSSAMNLVSSEFRNYIIPFILMVITITNRKIRMFLLPFLILECLLILIPTLKEFSRKTIGFYPNVSFSRLFYVTPFIAYCGGALAANQLLLRFSLLTGIGTIFLAGYSVVDIGQEIGTKIKRAKQDQNYENFYHTNEAVTLKILQDHSEPFRVASLSTHPAFLWYQGVRTIDGYLNLYPAKFHEVWRYIESPLFRRNKNAESYYVEWGNRVNLAFDAWQPDRFQADDFFNPRMLGFLNVKFIVSQVKLKNSNEINRCSARVEKSRLLLECDDPSLNESHSISATEEQKFRATRAKDTIFRVKSYGKLFYFAQKLQEQKITGNNLAVLETALQNRETIIESSQRHLVSTNQGEYLLEKIEMLNEGFRVQVSEKKSGSSVFVVNSWIDNRFEITLNNKPLKVFPVNFLMSGVEITEPGTLLILHSKGFRAPQT